MSLQRKEFYEFANFRLDLSEKVLLRDGKPVSLTPKVFETLKILIENVGHLLEKEELMRRIWKDRFVEESNLKFNIKMLRKALGDDVNQPRFIETVPRRGYRFIAEVEEIFVEQESKNSRMRGAFQKHPFAANALPKSQKLLFLIIAISILLLGAIIIGLWYTKNRSLKATAPVLSSSFALEKLSTNGKVFSAAISPDGKTVVFTNRNADKQSVWLRQLDSANNVEIIPPSDDSYYEFMFSPDGNFIYFSRRPKGVGEQTGIYRVSILGGIPSKIISEAQGMLSLSPDGEKISYVRCPYLDDEFCSLWIADSADGKNERKLASRPRPFRISDNRISPDGKWIAVAIGQSENAANEFSLIEINLETGEERELTTEKFFNIKHLSWLPNQSGLLLTASRVPNKHFRIWQVSATGEVEPLTNDSETYSVLSFDKNGSRLVSTQIKENFRLHLMSLENPSVNRILTDAARATFAPNKKIIFSSSMTGNAEIWSINADGSEQRQLTNNAADDDHPTASPTHGSVFFASNRTGEAHVWRMNADGSNQAQITQKTGGFPLFASPDGKWLYYHHGLNRTLWRVSPKGGDEQPVLNKEIFYFGFSPNGLQVAFAERQGEERILTIVSLSDGQTIKTFTPGDGKARLLEIAWLPDGKNVAYILSDSEFENYTLWLQPLDGAPPRQIAALGNEDVGSLEFSPDGKSFILIQGGWLHDAVLLKGLK